MIGKRLLRVLASYVAACCLSALAIGTLRLVVIDVLVQAPPVAVAWRSADGGAGGAVRSDHAPRAAHRLPDHPALVYLDWRGVMIAGVPLTVLWIARRAA